MEKKQWLEHMAYVMGFTHSRGKVERTGKVENVGITLIFQDLLMWEPVSPRTLNSGHTFSHFPPPVPGCDSTATHCTQQ